MQIIRVFREQQWYTDIYSMVWYTGILVSSYTLYRIFSATKNVSWRPLWVSFHSICDFSFIKFIYGKYVCIKVINNRWKIYSRMVLGNEKKNGRAWLHFRRIKTLNLLDFTSKLSLTANIDKTIWLTDLKSLVLW